MKKIGLSLMIFSMCISVVIMGVDITEAKLKKPFNPQDFSTYGTGLNEKLMFPDELKPYKPKKRFTPRSQPQKGKQQFDPDNVLPLKLDYREHFPSIRNQYYFGTCVSFAATGLREYYVGRDSSAKGEEVTHLSPLFMHFPRSAKQGMSLDEPFRSMSSRGVSPETERLYDSNRDNIDQFKQPLTKRQLMTALPYRISDYQVIYKGSRMIQEIKEAVANRDVVLVGIDVFPNFDNTPDTGIVPAVTKRERRGGHALVIAGYDDDKKWFIMRNSWGDDFGDNGYIYMGYDIFMEMANFFAFVATPLDTKYPPQGVNLKVETIENDNVKLNIAALDANSWELYRDGKQIAAGKLDESFTDKDVKAGEMYEYTLIVKNLVGETKSYPVNVEVKEREQDLPKAS